MWFQDKKLRCKGNYAMCMLIGHMEISDGMHTINMAPYIYTHIDPSLEHLARICFHQGCDKCLGYGVLIGECKCHLGEGIGEKVCIKHTNHGAITPPPSPTTYTLSRSDRYS